MSMPSATASRSGRSILIIMGLLVIASLGYFTTRYFTQKSGYQQAQVDIDQYKLEIQELEVRIQDFERTMEDKNLDLAEKEKLLNEKYKELESIVSRLQAERKLNRISQEKMKQLEGQLSTLQSQVDTYRAEIGKLQSDNQALTGQVDVFRENETRLRSEYRTLEERHVAQNKELEQTVKIASVLKTKDFRFLNVRKAGKEEQDVTFSRGRLKELKVCFTLQENRIAAQGMRELFLVIENPDGTIQANFGEGFSGSFPHNGSESVFTSRLEADFRQDDLEVCIPYRPANGEFAKGAHRVYVYAEGYLIGQSGFSVK